jgi:hypothetical protein
MSYATCLGGPADGAKVKANRAPFRYVIPPALGGIALGAHKRSRGAGLYRARTHAYLAFVGHFIVECENCHAFIGREGERPPEDCQLCGASLPPVRSVVA